MFEAFAWHTWQLCDAVSNEGPGVVLKWVNSISDIVAYRQPRDTGIGLMVVQEIPTEFEPRCKSKVANLKRKQSRVANLKKLKTC